MPRFVSGSPWLKLKSRIASSPLVTGTREALSGGSGSRQPWLDNQMESLESLLHSNQDGSWTAFPRGRLRWNALKVRCINQRPVALPWWWYRDFAYPPLSLVVLHNAVACRHDTMRSGLDPPYYGSIWSVEGVRVMDVDRMSDADAELAQQVVAQARRQARLLPGTYFYLGWLANHYGHFLLESLSHLWPLVATPLSDGSVQLAAFSMDPDPFFGSPAEALTTTLRRLGTGLDQITPIHEPVVFERLIVPTPSFFLGSKVHAAPVHARVWDAVQHGRYAEPNRAVYLSRKKYSLWGKIRRPLRNEQDVEEVFRRHGYEIIYPESLTFDEQLKLYGECAIIAGAMGSNVHNAGFMPPGGQSLILAPTSFLTLYMDALINGPKGNATNYFLVDVQNMTFDSQESWAVDVDELDRCLSCIPGLSRRPIHHALQGDVS